MKKQRVNEKAELEKIQEKTLILRRKTEEPFSVRLRPYREGEEAGMIACVREEYGNTYFKQWFYSPGRIRQEKETGAITFLVAESEEDGIVGILILKQFAPEEAMCEIASLILRRKYRGYGLAQPFLQYGLDIILSRSYSAAICLPVLFHKITQRLMYRLELRATGMLLNVCDLECITHSYENGRNRKHSLGIQVRAMEKRDAGTLYIPAEHREFAGRIYDSLGVVWQMADEHENEKVEEEWSRKYSVISWKNDSLQKSLEICIYCVGQDLEKQIRRLHSRHPLVGAQTAVLFLNCNDPQAVRGYEILHKMGYFFTGFKPLCSDREYMVLHHPGEIRIYFEDYQVSEDFASMIEYLKSCYEERVQNVSKEP